MKQPINEEFKRMQKLAGIQLNEIKVVSPKTKNKYVIRGSEGYYFINRQKALDYLSQFNNEEIDAEVFLNDDEGWGEFEQYIEKVEQMTNDELEDAMRSEMSYYYYSNPDEIQ